MKKRAIGQTFNLEVMAESAMDEMQSKLPENSRGVRAGCTYRVLGVAPGRGSSAFVVPRTVPALNSAILGADPGSGHVARANCP